MICELVGAPVEDREPDLRAVQRADRRRPTQSSRSSRWRSSSAAAEIYAYGAALAERRREQPADDIVTKLLQPNDHGEALTSDEFDLFFLLLTVAGNETTRNAAAGGMLALFEHPDQWQRLVDDPDADPDGGRGDRALGQPGEPVPPHGHPATPSSAGRPIAEGDKVVVFYASANRDESASLPPPQQFDVGRDPNPHVGFGGGGPHFCLGPAPRRPGTADPAAGADAADAGDQARRRAGRLRSNFINGIKHMPVRF